MPKSFSQMRPEELSTFIRKHAELNRDDSFLNSELIPWLKGQQDELSRTNNWAPEGGVPADPLKIGVNTIWNSGIIQGLGILLTELNRLKRLAAEAREETKRRTKKAEKLKEKNK